MATSAYYESYEGFENVTRDLSYSHLEKIPDASQEETMRTSCLLLHHNRLTILPRSIGAYANLISLDISNNGMSFISEEIFKLSLLRTLFCRNNQINETTLPKSIGTLSNLEVLNLSGNCFTAFPAQIFELKNLTTLSFGNNKISALPNDVWKLKKLEVLYMGGNRLSDVPAQIGCLPNLTSLVLCDNRLESLPPTLANLSNLKSLLLHDNHLSTLPPEIMKLSLVELSLRNNPLVVKFVQDLQFDPPPLLELAGRVIKLQKLPYKNNDLPDSLLDYLHTAQCCVNPKCKGVFFTTRFEHIKFVDFCGKYRLPFLQYLCSPTCSDASPSVCYTSDSDVEDADNDGRGLPVVSNKLKKVLLG